MAACGETPESRSHACSRAGSRTGTAEASRGGWRFAHVFALVMLAALASCTKTVLRADSSFKGEKVVMPVRFESPAGAKLAIDGAEVGVLPCEVQVSTHQIHSLKLEVDEAAFATTNPSPQALVLARELWSQRLMKDPSSTTLFTLHGRFEARKSAQAPAVAFGCDFHRLVDAEANRDVGLLLNGNAGATNALQKTEPRSKLTDTPQATFTMRYGLHPRSAIASAANELDDDICPQKEQSVPDPQATLQFLFALLIGFGTYALLMSAATV